MMTLTKGPRCLYRTSDGSFRWKGRFRYSLDIAEKIALNLFLRDLIWLLWISVGFGRCSLMECFVFWEKLFMVICEQVGFHWRFLIDRKRGAWKASKSRFHLLSCDFFIFYFFGEGGLKENFLYNVFICGVLIGRDSFICLWCCSSL